MINGIEIVFAVLVLAALIIISVLILKNGKEKRSNKPVEKTVGLNIDTNVLKETTAVAQENEPVNDEMAAAFLAIHLYMNEGLHDEESNVLTIQRIQRRYSPWSSKIYSTNNYPRK
jgi:hypothetical protein